MDPYVTYVRPRWSDMDVFGHVNHASLVTLLEDARVPLLFEDSADAGLSDFAKGTVVVRLEVRYMAPIVAAGQEIRMRISLSELKNASFTLDYDVHSGPSDEDTVAARAQVVLAPYDVARQRPRRLTEPERSFLAGRLGAGAEVRSDG